MQNKYAWFDTARQLRGGISTGEWSDPGHTSNRHFFQENEVLASKLVSIFWAFRAETLRALRMPIALIYTNYRNSFIQIIENSQAHKNRAYPNLHITLKSCPQRHE